MTLAVAEALNPNTPNQSPLVKYMKATQRSVPLKHSVAKLIGLYKACLLKGT